MKLEPSAFRDFTVDRKISRRGYHLTREYGVDPLELVMVRELMSPLAVLEQRRRSPRFMLTRMRQRARQQRRWPLKP